MSVRVVTDSACSLPPDLAAAHSVCVVPMWVSSNGRQWRDEPIPTAAPTAEPAGANAPIGHEMAPGAAVTTSCPSPGELVEAYRSAGADQIVVLTVSRRMSGMYEAAHVAARLVPELDVRVIDTATAAGAQGLVVLASARAALRGGTVEQVTRAAEDCARRARLVATLPSLETLARSGRVPHAAAWAGTWLGLHPVFEFRAGRAVPGRPGRGRRQALDRLVSVWRATVEGHEGDSLHLCAMHALEPEVAQDLVERVSSVVEPVTSFVGSFSAVMLAHTGPGLAGLAWWWEPTP